MNRRSFLSALGTLVVIPALPNRRVYSFLWDNPLVQVPNMNEDVFVLGTCMSHSQWVAGFHKVTDIQGHLLMVVPGRSSSAIVSSR